MEELNKIDGQTGFDRNRLSSGHPKNILQRLRKISNSFDGMFNVSMGPDSDEYMQVRKYISDSQY